MAEFRYEIVEELGVISENRSGWTRELNLVSWNGGEPKYDLRDWAPEHEKMGKGISMTKDEVFELLQLLEETLGDEEPEFDDDPSFEEV
jgi:hypothetical protein